MKPKGGELFRFFSSGSSGIYNSGFYKIHHNPASGVVFWKVSNGLLGGT